MPVSVLVLTLNEESNIAPLMESIAWCDDIVVLDSFSTDGTIQIATAHGARVVQRAFDNWSAHQNWAVEHLAFRHPWVLYLDADERCDHELVRELTARVTADTPEAAFAVRRKDYFMGRWLKRAQLYPTWLVRLFRPSRIHYQRLVNPVAVVNGPVGRLSGHILHHPFSHGIGHWIARHNRYSDLEAEELLKVRDGTAHDNSSVWTSDPNERRRALKNLFYRLPGRPVIKFIYYYLWRRGFLDGQPGMTYSLLQAMYEYMIDCKYRELLRKRSGSV